MPCRISAARAAVLTSNLCSITVCIFQTRKWTAGSAQKKKRCPAQENERERERERERENERTRERGERESAQHAPHTHNTRTQFLWEKAERGMQTGSGVHHTSSPSFCAKRGARHGVSTVQAAIGSTQTNTNTCKATEATPHLDLDLHAVFAGHHHSTVHDWLVLHVHTPTQNPSQTTSITPRKKRSEMRVGDMQSE